MKEEKKRGMERGEKGDREKRRKKGKSMIFKRKKVTINKQTKFKQNQINFLPSEIITIPISYF